MIEEVFPGLYLLKLPFPRNPLHDINVYLIKDGDRSLMVDSGMDIDECREELVASVKKLNVDLTRTEFFLTHVHPDHTGNVSVLANDTSTVYFSRVDSAFLNFNTPENRARRAALNIKNGLPQGNLLADSQFKMRNPMTDFAERREYAFHFTEEGERVSVGDYNFECIWTPGHTRGHFCLYEPDKKVFISGDHVLGNITPIIFAGSLDENPLGEYLDSLDKVYDLDVKLVLPGHRSLVTDMKKRISEIKHHHDVRIGETVAALAEGSKNAYQVAGRLHWDVKEGSWEAMPIWQRMFATSETLAHLRYLVEKQQVKQVETEDKITFSLI